MCVMERAASHETCWPRIEVVRELAGKVSPGEEDEEQGNAPEGVERLCLLSFVRLALESTHHGLPAGINGGEVRPGVLVRESERRVQENSLLLCFRRRFLSFEREDWVGCGRGEGRRCSGGGRGLGALTRGQRRGGSDTLGWGGLGSLRTGRACHA